MTKFSIEMTAEEWGVVCLAMGNLVMKATMMMKSAMTQDERDIASEIIQACVVFNDKTEAQMLAAMIYGTGGDA